MSEPVPLVHLARQHAHLRREILDAVSETIDDGRFVLGPRVAAFEEAFARWCGVAAAVGTSNGTAAIELALQALGVGPGDEVLVPALTFAATAEAVVAAGATPVFVDVDRRSYQMDPAAALAAVGARTAAVLPVHLHGMPAPMREIVAVAERHGLAVVEDAAQAHGARLDGRRVGTFGAAGTFSFYPGKNLGALGDAGAVVTDRPEVASGVLLRRDHGRTSRHEHVLVGRNERLDELQAGVLLVKLPHVDGWNERRRAIAARYDEALRSTGLRVVVPVSGAEPVHHVYAIEVAARDAVAEALAAGGISTGIHYPTPVPLQPAFADWRVEVPAAQLVADRILSLPMSPELDDAEVARVVELVLAVARPAD